MAKKYLLGIFDSGVGGLTVYRCIKSLIPEVPVIYVGDTARVPYGTKSPKTVTRYSNEIVYYLLQKNVSMIVMACNTASATAFTTLKRRYDIPIIDVIRPGARLAVRATRSGRIGVIGTRATINSGAYKREIQRIKPEIKVFSSPCPLFVPLVEEGWINTKITDDIIRLYLHPLLNRNIDTLVLGCTHYPLLKNRIKYIVDRNIVLVDSAVATSYEVREHLKGVINSSTQQGFLPKDRFFVTDDPDNFSRISKRFISRIVSAKKISLPAIP